MSRQVHTMSKTTRTILMIGVFLAVGLFLLVPAIVHDDHGVQHPSCINNLRQIHAAKQIWAEEHHMSTNGTPTWDDLRDYLKPTPWKCPNGGTYTIGRIGNLPTCSIPKDTAYWREHYP